MKKKITILFQIILPVFNLVFHCNIIGSNKSVKITHNLVSKDARMPGLISLRERQYFIIKHIEFVALKQASSQSKSILCFLTDQRTGAQ